MICPHGQPTVCSAGAPNVANQSLLVLSVLSPDPFDRAPVFVLAHYFTQRLVRSPSRVPVYAQSRENMIISSSVNYLWSSAFQFCWCFGLRGKQKPYYRRQFIDSYSLLPFNNGYKCAKYEQGHLGVGHNNIDGVIAGKVCCGRSSAQESFVDCAMLSGNVVGVAKARQTAERCDDDTPSDVRSLASIPGLPRT